MILRADKISRVLGLDSFFIFLILTKKKKKNLITVKNTARKVFLSHNVRLFILVFLFKTNSI